MSHQKFYKKQNHRKELIQKPIKLSDAVLKEIAIRAEERKAEKLNKLFPGSVPAKVHKPKYGNEGACGKARYLFELYHNNNCTVELVGQLNDVRICPVYPPNKVVEVKYLRSRKKVFDLLI